MTAPVMSATQEAVDSPAWRQLLLPLAAGMLLIGGLFGPEVVAAVHTWNSSTAYNHCFLIIPIALYLLWDRRFDLTGIAVRPTPRALLLGLPLGLAWLAAERLGIMEGRQLVAVSFVELLLLALLGRRLWWAMAGPLLYLYFLVPFGEFLTPKLQDVTTWFIRHGLEILGVPAFIDGYVIEIPQGTFFVAEACAGLRFLIASIAFGCLYALMMYRSPVRRGVFILVSIVVPIFANGLRGIGIVYLGYLLGSAQAAAADHVIYGWVFFSAVILLLIALGLPFRQDEASTHSAAGVVSNAEPPVPLRNLFAIILGAVLVAAISPAVSYAMNLAATMSAVTPSRLDVNAECTVQGTAADVLSPIRMQRVTCNNVALDISWEAFSPRSTAAPVMAERRRMVMRAETEGLAEHWLDTDSGNPSAWRILNSNDPAYMIAVSVWVDGQAVRPGLAMRLRMALNSLLGSAYAPIVVTVTPAVDWDRLSVLDRKSAEASLPSFLRSHPELAQVVGRMSALR